MAAKIPMIATTIINSIKVKPCCTFFIGSVFMDVSSWMENFTRHKAVGVPKNEMRCFVCVAKVKSVLNLWGYVFFCVRNEDGLLGDCAASTMF